VQVTESDLVDLYTDILTSSYSNQVVTEYIITSAMKLTTRLTDASQIERIRGILLRNQTNLDVEIQQRAAEYGNMFSYRAIMKGVLEKMPPPEIREEQRVMGEAPKKKTSTGGKKKKPAKITEQDMLLDLMGDEPTAEAGGANGTQGSNTDLLMDILGGGAAPSSAPAQKSNVDSIMSLFGPGSASPAAPTASASSLLGDLGGAPSTPSGPAVLQAFNKNGLLLTFQVQHAPAGIQALARFRNTGSARLTGVNLQAAVPRTLKLQMQAISASEIEAGGEATQVLRVVGVNGVSFHHFALHSANDEIAGAGEAEVEAQSKPWGEWGGGGDGTG
jgi:AP-1 complex subunit gamma-1